MSPKDETTNSGPFRHITYLNLLEPVSGQRMKPDWINPYTGLILHLPLTGVAALPSSTNGVHSGYSDISSLVGQI